MTPEAAISAVSNVSAVPTMLRVITEYTGLRLSLIAHVTENEWTCCAVNDTMAFGLDVGATLDVATTLCSEVRAYRAPIVISDVPNDPVYRDHHTPRIYKLKSYIAVPIFMPGGDYFGNVCALDSEPRDLSQPKTLAMFQLFAELLALQLAAEARHTETSTALLDANAVAELREQFIAVLGHDVRTPLQSITLGAQVLASKPLPDWTAPILRRIERGAERIGRLVDDVLDFARGRLGGGVPVAPSRIPDVLAMLRVVAEDARAAHPHRELTVVTHGGGEMLGDPTRLAQLLQNLVSNALTHGEGTVAVSLELGADALVMRVANGGAAIAEATRARMFEPYQRGASRSEGLGLGLYIASQIVKSHGGAIGVTSVPDATTVTCTIPRR